VSFRKEAAAPIVGPEKKLRLPCGKRSLSGRRGVHFASCIQVHQEDSQTDKKVGPGRKGNDRRQSGGDDRDVRDASLRAERNAARVKLPL
jgi:hypothetical protein